MYKIPILLALLLLYSCSNSVEQPSRFGMNQWPVVECLVITDENGVPLGTWCNPEYMTSGNSLILYSSDREDHSPESSRPSQALQPGDGPIPQASTLEYPYPNPSSGQITVRFTLAVHSPVFVWVVPAKTHPQEFSQSDIFAGHVFFSAKGIAVKVLFDQEDTSPGVYQVRWDLKDYIGNNIPAGFYRIYALLRDQLWYQDVLVYHTPDDLPQDLHMGLSMEQN